MTRWITDLGDARRLEAFAQDAGFQDDWRRVKREAKVNLARLIQRSTGISVDPDSMFDIQAKRIHEYKRQHLNLLHVITLYNRIRRLPGSAHGSAHRDLRRQVRAELHHGEAHHQARQFVWPTS